MYNTSMADIHFSCIESDNDREEVWMHGRGKEGEGYEWKCYGLPHSLLILSDINLSCVLI